jgi:XTP/dITP diphosphohydrolase
MRTRHPHVFAQGEATTVAEVTAKWEEIKATEKAQRTSVLEGIPEKLSALARAASVHKRSREVVVHTPPGELPEFSGEEQLGELLFALVAKARAQGLDAEKALRARTRAFEALVEEHERTLGRKNGA